VLVPGREDPNRLRGLAAVVWELLDHPIDEGALSDAVASLVGPRAGLPECLAEMLAADLVLPIPSG
jgi:hypothetical protein